MLRMHTKGSLAFLALMVPTVGFYRSGVLPQIVGLWALGAISWTRDGPRGRDDLRGFSGIAGGGTLDEHR